MWDLLVGFDANPVGEPDAGKPHVRFDERQPETEWGPAAPTTAPAVDSTRVSTADGESRRPAVLVANRAPQRTVEYACVARSATNPSVLALRRPRYETR